MTGSVFTDAVSIIRPGGSLETIVRGPMIQATTLSSTDVLYGFDPLVFTAVGSLPPGLALAADGHLTGRPTALGTYTFAVTASNGLATSAPLSATITVLPGLRPDRF